MEQSFSWSYGDVCIFLRIYLEEKEFLCDREERGNRRHKLKSQIDVLSSNIRTKARHPIRQSLSNKRIFTSLVYGLIIYLRGGVECSKYVESVCTSITISFWKSQSDEADLKCSSYRRDCKSRCKSNEMLVWQSKGTTKLNRGHFGPSHQCDKPDPWTFLEEKVSSVIWIQFNSANYVIAQTPERKIQWSW